jgi:hypothetical protein
MTRTLVPDDWNRGQERWSANWFAQARSVCKAHARFRNAGYKRKVQDKKKVRTMPSALRTPDQTAAGRPMEDPWLVCLERRRDEASSSGVRYVSSRTHTISRHGLGALSLRHALAKNQHQADISTAPVYPC